MEQESSIARWNRLYEGVPEHLRFWLIVWILIGVGAINMMLTIWFGFPFGLLVVLAIAAMAWIRISPQLNLPEAPAPQMLQWQPATGPEDEERTVLSGWANSFPTFNGWMDNLDELPRLGVHLGILVVAGIINMLLSINSEFPFGILVLIALVALAVIRGPWVRARTRAKYREFRAQKNRPAGLLPAATPEASGDIHAGMAGPGPDYGGGNATVAG
jgi:hypothetical protein